MKFSTIILSLFISLSCHAQNASSGKTTANNRLTKELAIIQDSLAYYKHQIDSLKHVLSIAKTSVGDEPDSRYMRLFTPTYFYGDMAKRHFSLNKEDSLTTDYNYLIDNALMNVYLNSPELVLGSWRNNVAVTQIAKDNVDKNEAKSKEDINIVSYEMPKAEEAKISDVNLFIERPNFWTLSGDYYLQIMQNYYSGNWYQGGESNYSALTRLAFRANYNNKQKIKWENTLEFNLGFQTNKSDSVHSVKTSSDMIRYTGKFGLQASKRWYYTLQAVANSQFMRSFATNSYNVNSDFMSPLDLNVSLGMDYTIGWFKNKFTGTVHLAPFAFNYKYVDRLALAQRNGIDKGKHSKFDYGSTFTLDFNWKLSNNVSWRSRLYGYTTYKRMDMQWENTFNMKVSKYISANIYIYPRFDDSNISRKDDDLGYFQLKEYTSLGLSYSF